MLDADMKNYHEWLLKRSIKGLLYRKYYLYPKIWKRVSGRVLDVGCGIGDFVRMTPNSVGVDINKYNVDFCKKNSIAAIYFDNNKLPFSDCVFDTVLFDNVIEHIYDPSEILVEAIRVLKVGGKLILGVPTLKHFFHDSDHKIYYSTNSLECGLGLDGIRFVELFTTPKNRLIQHFFVHTCRWAVYEKTGSNY